MNIISELDTGVTRSSLAELVALHQAAFPNFFLTQLGPRFLTEYYATVVLFSGGIVVTARDGVSLCGFAAGFVDPPGFYRSLRKQRLRLMWSLAPTVLRNPALVSRLRVNSSRAKNNSEEQSPFVAELASLAVAPAYQGQGIGGRLVEAFAKHAASMRAGEIKLTTDATENEAVNAFYIRRGFVAMGAGDVGHGRHLVHYSRSIAA
ncbi:MAG: GNAT family N-acetyltransferase [Candidatus Paceibacterota bacterium]